MGKGGVSDALWMHGFALYSTVVYDFWPDLLRQQDGRSQCMIFSPLYDCESVLIVLDMVNDVAVIGLPRSPAILIVVQTSSGIKMMRVPVRELSLTLVVSVGSSCSLLELIPAGFTYPKDRRASERAFFQY
jgi:hypothetical protein